MKIIIPSNGNEISSNICTTFGRAVNFLLVDSETLDTQVIKNEQNMQSTQGAGIQSAQLVTKSGADTLITLNCGPKAYRVLAASGIKVYKGEACSIADNINKLKDGTLDTMSDSNVEGHWV